MISYKLTSRIPAIIADFPDELEPVLEEGANGIAEEAKGRVPVDSGALHDAIHVEVGEERMEFIVVAGDDDAFYGHIVENGGVSTAPRPFLVPASEARRQGIYAAMMEKLGDV